jgi:hypothetical protein
MLSELARLGARLIIQRAVEDEFDSWLGRGRYERRPERQRGLRNYESGLRNGFRSRHVQTAEGELRIEIPQARQAAMPFVSKLFPKWHCKRLLRTDPLKALVIGGFVRGLSMRDVESLCEEAGSGRPPARRSRGSARSCTSASKRSLAARSMTSTSSCCFWTRSICRSVRAARRRVRSAPRELTKTVTGHWFPCASARGSPKRTGSSSAAI